MKRIIFLTFASLFLASSVFATEPSSRYETRFVYNPKTTHSLLFGGLTALDTATKQPYDLGDSWDWNGARWTQLFPAHSPSGREGHAMVYDSKRDRMVVFGGRGGHGKVDVNDTWFYKGSDWTEIATSNAPSPRGYMGFAYDPVRDRIVAYGGLHLEADAKTSDTYRDTWEFDGTDWTHIADNGPDMTKTQLAYDTTRNQMLMLAMDSSSATHMFVYDPSSGSWNELKPAALPACVADAAFVNLPDLKLVLAGGGTCAAPPTATEDMMAWDGTTWTPVAVTTNIGAVFGAGVTYDQSRGAVYVFGGSPSSAILGATAVVSADLNALAGTVWTTLSDSSEPERRNLQTFVTDTDRNTIWMFGGVNDIDIPGDLWQFQYGKWTRATIAGAPSTCQGSGAYDTDRQKLVVVCSDGATFEFDGSAWSELNPKHTPGVRKFSAMTYDKTIKKTVLFGGHDGTNYVDHTWVWDGTDWTDQSSDRPGERELAMLWYDAKMRKTVLYGGIGRLQSQNRVIRYDDMWTFDGTHWTQIKTPDPNTNLTAGTPGLRYGALIAIDPRTNDLLLYGGIRTDTIMAPPVTDPNGTPIATQVQSYANDWWQWDGSTQTWTQINFTNSPPARENAGMAWDPSQQTMVIYGGWGGTYFSDLWTETPAGDSWRPRIINTIRLRPSR